MAIKSIAREERGPFVYLTFDLCRDHWLKPYFAAPTYLLIYIKSWPIMLPSGCFVQEKYSTQSLILKKGRDSNVHTEALRIASSVLSCPLPIQVQEQSHMQRICREARGNNIRYHILQLGHDLTLTLNLGITGSWMESARGTRCLRAF